MLTSLAILGDTSLKLTSTSSNDENGTVSLRSTSDHVLDEVTVTWGVDDSDIVSRGLELPEGDIDGDTSLTLSLQLVENPCVLEGTLAEFSGFLFILSDICIHKKKKKKSVRRTIFAPHAAPPKILRASMRDKQLCARKWCRHTFSNFSMVRLSIPPHL